MGYDKRSMKREAEHKRSRLQRRLRSYIVQSLVIGVVVVVLLPPFIPSHKSSLSQTMVYGNRYRVYYPTLSNPDSLGCVDVMRTSQTNYQLTRYSINEYKNIYNYQLLENYLAPLPVYRFYYLKDLNNDGVQEMAFYRWSADSLFLCVLDLSTNQTEQKLIDTEVEHFYLASVFYDCDEDDCLYLNVRYDKSDSLFCGFYSYQNGDDAPQLISGVHNGFRFLWLHGYERYPLFIDPDVNHFRFYISDRQSGKTDTVPYACGQDLRVLFQTHGWQQAIPQRRMDNVILFEENNVIKRLNLDSLFLTHRVVLQDVPLHFPRGYSSIKMVYSCGDVVIFCAKYEDYNRLCKYNVATQKVSHFRIKERVGIILYYGDLDDNGKQDLVFSNSAIGEESVCIKEEGNRNRVVCSPLSRDKLFVVNAVKLATGELSFMSRGVNSKLAYFSNRAYYQQGLIDALILLFFGVLGFFLDKWRENKLLKLRDAQNQTVALQLENVQKRIDPHFIFNSLNNVGALILEGKPSESYDYLTKVSAVLHKALKNKSVLVTVEEEITFCTSVLDAQMQRFEGRFDYELTVDKTIDEHWLMPSNILNNMTDNCIKHGFANIDYSGLIVIEFVKKERGFLVVVEDNGVGLSSSDKIAETETSTGTGLDICYQYVALFNATRKSNFLSFSIYDLYHNDGNPCGTRCEFYVPDDLKIG